MNPQTGLHVEGLDIGYNDVTVVRDVTFQVPAGSVVALLGPNGAGKTTTLRCIAGLLPAKAGRLTFAGEMLVGHDAADRVQRGITFVPEGRAIFPNLTVAENLRLFGRLVRSGPGVRASSALNDAIEAAVAQFPRLQERMRQVAGTMSGGEQQMLAISRVFFGDPRLVVIDEMSLGLAPVIVSELFRFVADLRSRTGCAVLLTDQFVHQTLEVADYVYVLQNGRLRLVADPTEPGLEDAIHRLYVGAGATVETSPPLTAPSPPSRERPPRSDDQARPVHWRARRTPLRAEPSRNRSTPTDLQRRQP